MTPIGLRAARAIVRGWAWLYTRGLPRDIADTRRAEIESDLWDSMSDPATPAQPVQILSRLLRGLLDDVGWRLERAERTPRHVRLSMIAAAVGCLLAVVWTIVTMRPSALPVPATRASIAERAVLYPPPPPPPPPPARTVSLSGSRRPPAIPPPPPPPPAPPPRQTVNPGRVPALGSPASRPIP